MANTQPLEIPFDKLPDCAIMRLPPILTLTGYSKATWWDGIAKGKFPQPLQIGPRSVGWRVGDIRALLNSFTVKKEIDPNVTKAAAVNSVNSAARKQAQS